METVLKFLLLFQCCHLLSAQFPIICRSNSSDPATEGSGICCPLFNDEVCGGPQRGRCDSVDAMCNISSAGNYTLWIEPYFNRMCVCQYPFSGVSCGECWYGLTPTADGKNCEKSSVNPRIRRDYLQLSSSEQENYKYILQLMKEKPSDFYIAESNASTDLSIYDYLAALHYMSMTVASTDLAHDGSGFPTWHRAFLLIFERLAQQVSDDPNFSLAYVDEYKEDNIRNCIELLGGDGVDTDDCHIESDSGKNCSCFLAPGSIFSDWKDIGPKGIPQGKISRALGCDHTAKIVPKQTAYEYALTCGIYTASPWNKSKTLIAFSNILEGYAEIPSESQTAPPIGNPRDNHNRVHVYMGGTMDDVKTAASDPFFWLHHAFIDLMLESWMEIYPSSMTPWTETEAPPGHSYNDCQGFFVPLLPHAMFFHKSETFGYKYDNLKPKPVPPSNNSSPDAARSLTVTTLVLIALIVTSVLIY